MTSIQSNFKNESGLTQAPSELDQPKQPFGKYVPPFLRKAQQPSAPQKGSENSKKSVWGDLEEPQEKDNNHKENKRLDDSERFERKEQREPPQQYGYRKDDRYGSRDHDDNRGGRFYGGRSDYQGRNGDVRQAKNDTWAARGAYDRDPNPFEDIPVKADKVDFDKYEEIKVETSGRDVPRPVESFADIDLGERLNQNIQLAKFDKPTPIQKYSLPTVLEGRDVMACAQTGSGKTAAFLFPIIAKILQTPPQPDQGFGRRKHQPLALILAPTRELACQIQDDAKKFCWKTGIKSAVVYGGVPIGQQLREIDRGFEILVATPGRLVDIMERGRISLSQIKYLVLDEADRMLDMGFEPQIRKIVEEEDMPSIEDRITLMFSATFPKEIQRLASSFLNDYIFIAVGKLGSPTELVTQKFLRVEEADKRNILLDLINTIKGLTIIFVETKKKADMLEDYLINERFPATSIHGDRTQQDREYALRSFSSGRTPFLIATDIAARGLHIEDVAHVVNYDMPTDIDNYVHRIGRTARAGKTGLATSFISEENINVIPKLLEVLDDSGQDVPTWLDAMRPHRSYGGGGYHRGGGGGYGGRGGGGGRFGGRDYRNHSNQGYQQNRETHRRDDQYNGGGGGGRFDKRDNTRDSYNNDRRDDYRGGGGSSSSQSQQPSKPKNNWWD